MRRDSVRHRNASPRPVRASAQRSPCGHRASVAAHRKRRFGWRTIIHEDAASGVSRSRPGPQSRARGSRRGDTLVVWRLDRLGRSLRDLLDLSKMLRERDVALRSLTDHIDTATAAGRMLYAVAQFRARRAARTFGSRDAGRQAPWRTHWPSSGPFASAGSGGKEDA
jgi:DNA invertase Pin-like site-specific DNA recombinase